MKNVKTPLILFFTLFCLSTNGQIVFEAGYIIDNDGVRTNCLIKNQDWSDNPKSFEYKLSENGTTKEGTLESIQGFGVGEESSFVRFVGAFDQSRDELNRLSKDKKPIFKETSLFLRTLIAGKATLYSYEYKGLKRFFFSKEDGEIEQLIYKKYLTEDDRIGVNIQYRQQLWENLKCEIFSIQDLEKMDYKRRYFIQFFVDYNQCKQATITRFDKRKKSDWFNLRLRPGITYSSLSIFDRTDDGRQAEFDSKLSYRVGLEAEIILPFNKNKWAILFEPTFNTYDNEVIYRGDSVSVDYTSIEIPLGVRYYLFLNDDIKLFMNLLFYYDVTIGDSKLDYFDDRRSFRFEVNGEGNAAFGIGADFKNRISVELKYIHTREILNGFIFWDSRYSNFSLIFGVNLF